MIVMMPGPGIPPLMGRVLPPAVLVFQKTFTDMHYKQHPDYKPSSTYKLQLALDMTKL